MRCVTRVMAPACFGVIGNFTKHVQYSEDRNSVVVFLVHIKDITENMLEALFIVGVKESRCG